MHTHSERIHGLDTLRACAIVLVVLHHYVLFVSGAPTFGWVGEIGWVGVDLFFALSGYLIGNQIFAALRSAAGLSLPRFYARRFLRTLPAYYVVLALYFLWPDFRAGATLPPLWKFLTFTQNINLNPGTAFSHAWSLCIEEQFYVLLPACALAIAALRRSLWWTWVGVGLAFGAGMAMRAWVWDEYVGGDLHGRTHYYQFIYYSSLCRFDELMAGVALALLKNFHGRAWGRLTRRGNVMLGAGLLVCSLAFYLFLLDRLGFMLTVFGYPLLALGFGLLMVAALSEGSLLAATAVPGAGRLALYAYAIYLTHKQACILANAALQARGVDPGQGVAIAIMLALSLVSGMALYHLVEQPFMALRARWVPTLRRS
ncbi:MAG: acyltransferase [Pseudomonadota bacterium]